MLPVSSRVTSATRRDRSGLEYGVMTTRIPETPETLDLCCGGKKCPTLRDAGDEIVATDPTKGPGEIRFAKTDVPRIIAWLQGRVG